LFEMVPRQLKNTRQPRV